MSILGNRAKDTMDINDEIIASTMMASAKAAADAYFNSTLASTTPELKALYSSSLNQVLGGHTAITALSIKRGWVKPYNTPTQQLTETLKKSR